MRKLLAVLAILAVSAVAQAPMSQQLDNLYGSLTKINQAVVLRGQIDDEYSAMSLELARLGDRRVKAIMLPHLEKILTLNGQISKLGLQGKQ